MKFLIFLFLFISCQEKKETVENIQTLQNYSLENWIYTEHIGEIKYTGEIKKPVGFPFLLLQLNYLNSDSSSLYTDCVYYTAPFRDFNGELAIVQNKLVHECSESIEKDPKVLIQNIKILKLGFYNSTLRLDINNKAIKIPFYNLSKKITHKKLQNIDEGKLLNGLRFINQGNGTLTSNEELIGKYSDKYSDDTAIVCKKMSDSCEVKGEDICYRCKFGTFTVVDYDCPKGGSKYCGINHCGEKNEPACNRGKITTESKDDGICNIGLIPTRDKNNILVCK